MEKSDSIIIIPTYNEKENIEKIIRAIFGLEKYFHILVIDDGSPDGTAAIVHHLMEDEFKGRLFIVERSGNWDLARPISPDSSGLWNATTATSSRWTPTSATIQTTCHASMPPAMTRATTSAWAAATSAV